jgi:hypothetical protein
MTILPHYHQFDGISVETGAIRNVLDYQGIKAPHTSQPLSEALLFGVSGGVVAGYFTFEFPGYDPQFLFLNRFSFDPVTVIFDRLGIKATTKQTDKPDKGLANLVAALESGKPATVFLDSYTLPYNNLKPGKDDYGNTAVVVYGHDEGTVYIADRARVPLTVTANQFASARARIKKDKHRVRTLDAPDLDKLPAAVEAGLKTCANNFTGEPPVAPLKGKFGLAAYHKWADLLTDTKEKLSWVKYFPAGARLYSALKFGYQSIEHHGTGGNASRRMYADFLDEAAVILSKPALMEVAGLFRAAAKRWDELSNAMLPDGVPLMKETRELLNRDYQLFIQQGGASLAERQKISQRLQAIRDEVAAEFPMSDSEVAAFREALREHVLKVHDAEKPAAEALQKALK